MNVLESVFTACEDRGDLLRSSQSADHAGVITNLPFCTSTRILSEGVDDGGGIEIARTEERMQELTRRMTSARTWGIEPVSLLNPEQVKELVPFIDQRLILGGFYTPGAGVVDSLRAATMMREEAANDGLTVAANT